MKYVMKARVGSYVRCIKTGELHKINGRHGNFVSISGVGARNELTTDFEPNKGPCVRGIYLIQKPSDIRTLLSDIPQELINNKKLEINYDGYFSRYILNELSVDSGTKGFEDALLDLIVSVPDDDTYMAIQDDNRELHYLTIQIHISDYNRIINFDTLKVNDPIYHEKHLYDVERSIKKYFGENQKLVDDIQLGATIKLHQIYDLSIEELLGKFEQFEVNEALSTIDRLLYLCLSHWPNQPFGVHPLTHVDEWKNSHLVSNQLIYLLKLIESGQFKRPKVHIINS